MLVAGLDVETTGLDENESVITEVGMVVWETDTNTPVRFYNYLIAIEDKVPEKITQLTGITDELLETHGFAPQLVAEEVSKVISSVPYVCAHNAQFDKKFIKKFLESQSEYMMDKVWIDTSCDLDYPPNIETRKLVHLAAEHGFVNPFAHRAVTDVLTMLQIASKYNWAETIENATLPKTTVRALVSFNEKDKAKNTGYRWEGNSKVWIKTIKSKDFEKEQSKCQALGFEIGEWKNG